MKKSLFRKTLAGLAVVAMAVFSLAAQGALPTINGSISFYGGVSLNGPIGSSTAFTGFSGPGGSGSSDPFVLGTSQTGDYAAVPGDTPAVFTPFTFNPAPASAFQLWQFAVGGKTYSFTATSVEIVMQDSHFLDLRGTGVASITGYADTPGTWTITDTGSTPTISFGAATVAVPEPSTLALMLAFVPMTWLLTRRGQRASLEKQMVRV